MPYTIVRIDTGWRCPCGAPIKAFDFRIEPEPSQHALLARKKDHGRAEAALIAVASLERAP